MPEGIRLKPDPTYDNLQSAFKMWDPALAG
jgi:hypothetical protein